MSFQLQDKKFSRFVKEAENGCIEWQGALRTTHTATHTL